MFIEFSLTDDAMPEDDELFMLRLTNVQGGAVLGDPNESKQCILTLYCWYRSITCLIW